MDDITNATLLAAINKIGQNQDSFLEKLRCIEKSVNDNTDAICTLSISFGDVKEQVGGLTSNIAELEQKVLSLTKENITLREQVNEIDVYKRKWNLKISGVPEHENENVKMTVIDLLSRVSPEIADFLQNSVDVAHYLGPKNGKTGKNDTNKQPRRIIVQFLSCTHRDRVWADAKRSEVLKQKHIKITEDLTQHVKDARAKLWPLVEQARKEGKLAG